MHSRTFRAIHGNTVRKIRREAANTGVASSLDGCRQLASHKVGEAFEAHIDHANFDASAPVAGVVPRSDSVYRHAAAHHAALVRMWRDNSSDVDHTFQFRRFRKQGYGDVCLDVVRADVKRRRAVCFEEVSYSSGVSLDDVQRNGDRLTVMYRRPRGSGLSGQPACPRLLYDAVEVGVQVGMLGQRKFAFVRQDLDVECATRLSDGRGRGSAALLGVYACTA